MLKKLKVQNFALIDYADIDFENTFIVITGETGAGKSILLDALNIVLGERIDVSVMFDKNKKTIVEATFDISNTSLKDFFEQNELDYNDETMLRREISIDGKSRAFINDTPVNVSLLKTLREYLIDIHSQHQNLLINSNQFHYNFIDALAGALEERNIYTNIFKQYQKEKKELNTLIAQQTSIQKEIDYYQYLVKELQEVNIQEGEIQQIEEELNQLKNAENIIQQLSLALQALQEAETNAIQLIHQAKNNLQSISKYHSNYDELFKRLNTNIIDIKDIAREIENQLHHINANPEKIQTLTERIDIINKLLKKHQVKTDIELLQIQSELGQKLNSYQNLDETIEEKRKQLSIKEKEILERAQKLSEKRISVKPQIEKECKEMLKYLSMVNAQFIIEISDKFTHGTLDEFGKDNIKFLFSANKGVEPVELQKAASGGEISRLMLCMKSMIAQKISLPTIIFDEIDTGTSGPIAARMGDMMKKISEGMQVITITHLPQIAAKGKQHLYVSKEETNHKTISKIKTLNETERVLEIAKMLSSGQPGEAALQNAKELLTQN